MSVITWDGCLLAADRQVTCNDDVIEQYSKLRVFTQGLVAACTGFCESSELLFQWLATRDPAAYPAAQRGEHGSTLVLYDKTQDSIVTYEWEAVDVPCLDVPMAWGSGRALALGAMHAGANAVEAAVIACRHNSTCGGGIDYVDVLALEQGVQHVMFKLTVSDCPRIRAVWR